MLRGFLLYLLERLFPGMSPFLLSALAGLGFGSAEFLCEEDKYEV